MQFSPEEIAIVQLRARRISLVCHWVATPEGYSIFLAAAHEAPHDLPAVTRVGEWDVYVRQSGPPANIAQEVFSVTNPYRVKLTKGIIDLINFRAQKIKEECQWVRTSEGHVISLADETYFPDGISLGKVREWNIYLSTSKDDIGHPMKEEDTWDINEWRPQQSE
jgi:hypothetical protein